MFRNERNNVIMGPVDVALADEPPQRVRRLPLLQVLESKVTDEQCLGLPVRLSSSGSRHSHLKSSVAISSGTRAVRTVRPPDGGRRTKACKRLRMLATSSVLPVMTCILTDPHRSLGTVSQPARSRPPLPRPSIRTVRAAPPGYPNRRKHAENNLPPKPQPRLSREKAS